MLMAALQRKLVAGSSDRSNCGLASFFFRVRIWGAVEKIRPGCYVRILLADGDGEELRLYCSTVSYLQLRGWRCCVWHLLGLIQVDSNIVALADLCTDTH